MNDLDIHFQTVEPIFSKCNNRPIFNRLFSCKWKSDESFVFYRNAWPSLKPVRCLTTILHAKLTFVIQNVSNVSWTWNGFISNEYPGIEFIILDVYHLFHLACPLKSSWRTGWSWTRRCGTIECLNYHSPNYLKIGQTSRSSGLLNVI